MGEHINTKKDPLKHHAKGFSDGQDVKLQRRLKASFKTYINQLEEDLLEQEMTSEEWLVEELVQYEDTSYWSTVTTCLSESEAKDCVFSIQDDIHPDHLRIRQA